MSGQKIQFSEQQLWQAFRYVGAELSVADAEAFEQQMLQDAALCEAVADVILLLSSVAVSGRPRHVGASAALSRKSQFGGRSRTVAVTATVCCCLALVLMLPQLPGTSETTVVQTETADAELLLAAWAENISIQTDEDSEYDESVQHELAVPDWMLAAVTLSDIEQLKNSDMPVDELVPDDSGVF
ncbi:MAG: hypothetical protein P8J37_07455 [Fuerstiella sp.]|nr:hypothetical protein [Fuerstiella sp.]